jgi:CBS domain-containing protein
MVSILDQLTLKDLPKKDKIITIGPNEQLTDVFVKIFSNRITSAPVIDQKGTIIGSIGIMDIVLFALNVCQSSQELATFFGLTSDSENFIDFENIKNYLKDEKNKGMTQNSVIASTAQFLANYSHQNQLHVLKPDCSFKDIVTTLSKVHRLAIGDETIINYISQSEVVRLLKEKDAFAHIASKTIEELNLCNKPLISVKEGDRVIEAFKLMVTNNVSGVAVINDKQQLVGQISSSDIKCISLTGEMVPRLYETYHHYRKILIQKYKAPEITITVPLKANLSEVLETIINNRLHRVFIVGNDNHAAGVISLTDILKLLVN